MPRQAKTQLDELGEAVDELRDLVESLFEALEELRGDTFDRLDAIGYQMMRSEPHRTITKASPAAKGQYPN